GFLVGDLRRAQTADAHQLAHILGMALEEDRGAAQAALHVARATGAQVRGQRMIVLELALLGDAKALRDGLGGLELVTHGVLGKRKAPWKRGGRAPYQMRQDV